MEKRVSVVHIHRDTPDYYFFTLSPRVQQLDDSAGSAAKGRVYYFAAHSQGVFTHWVGLLCKMCECDVPRTVSPSVILPR